MAHRDTGGVYSHILERDRQGTAEKMTERTSRTDPRLEVGPRWKENGEITCSVCGNDKSREKYRRLYLALETFHCKDCTRVARKRLINVRDARTVWDPESNSTRGPVSSDRPTSLAQCAGNTLSITRSLFAESSEVDSA